MSLFTILSFSAFFRAVLPQEGEIPIVLEAEHPQELATWVAALSTAVLEIDKYAKAAANAESSAKACPPAPSQCSAQRLGQQLAPTSALNAVFVCGAIRATSCASSMSCWQPPMRCLRLERTRRRPLAGRLVRPSTSQATEAAIRRLPCSKILFVHPSNALWSHACAARCLP